ncbi:hypothetical protein KGF54_001012 [Candida jiufengensis]|uniref:uncharacterized protein n=1 Tax=Candida jiufengensis TaxID=497108 RepID=UPI002224262A|nr:uncharacterized protein KGF54_001012 [Candida jiufengensis]KAI5956537.1 hypothetical protein KGF54_001012 [Candida jiufengensis]
MLRFLIRHRPIIINTYIRHHLIQKRLYSKNFSFFNKNLTPSLPEKFTNFVTNILTEQHDKILDQPVQELIEKIPNLKKDLKKSLDFENKLYTVLSYDPVLIDPRLYLHFYYPEINGPMKQLLIERLLFHQQYVACWELFMGETLIDLDDFLTTVSTFLTKQNNKFAIIDFILSQPNFEEKETYKIQIIDSLVHIFNINAKQVLNIYHEINDLRTFNDILNYNDNGFIASVIKLKRIMKISLYKGATKHQIYEILVQYPQILIQPGWVSCILPKFEFYSCLLFDDLPENIKPFMEAVEEILSTGVRLNDVDATYLLHSKVNPFALFSAYRLSPLQKQISNHIVKLMLKEPRNEEVKAAYLISMKLLDLPLAIECLDLLIPDEPSVLTLVKPLEESMKNNIVMGLKNFNSAHYIELIPYYSNNVKISRHLITTYSESIHASIEDFNKLALIQPQSKQAILEIFRSALLRSKFIDETFFAIILNSILRKTITKIGDFNTSYESLSSNEKNTFHNSLRSLAQTISLLNTNDIALVMDIIHKTFDSNSFYYKNDPIAKEYLLKIVSHDVYRFILRKENKIELLQDIMSKMQTSTFWVTYWLLYATVLDDYGNSIKLLKYYSNDKHQLIQYFPALVSGILNSKNLNINNKIRYIDVFLKESKKYGFNNILKMKNGFEIINYFKKAARSNQLDDESIKWLIQFSKNNKYLRRVMANVRVSKRGKKD